MIVLHTHRAEDAFYLDFNNLSDLERFSSLLAQGLDLSAHHELQLEVGLDAYLRRTRAERAAVPLHQLPAYTAHPPADDPPPTYVGGSVNEQATWVGAGWHQNPARTLGATFAIIVTCYIFLILYGAR